MDGCQGEHYLRTTRQREAAETMGGADFTLVPIIWKETSTEVGGKKTSIFSKQNLYAFSKHLMYTAVPRQQKPLERRHMLIDADRRTVPRCARTSHLEPSHPVKVVETLESVVTPMHRARDA